MEQQMLCENKSYKSFKNQINVWGGKGGLLPHTRGKSTQYWYKYFS